MDNDLPGGLPDEELVQQVQCGNHSAFNELCSRYWPIVYSVVLKVVRNREDAQDIEQEAFEKAYQKVSTLQQAYSFQAWLLRIARNTATDWLRKRKRTVPLTDATEVEAMADSLDEKFIQDEQIRAALQQLQASKPLIYEVVILHAQGYSHEEIAQRLPNLRVSTVRTYLSTGRKMLRRAISRERPPKKKSRLFAKGKRRTSNNQQQDERQRGE